MMNARLWMRGTKLAILALSAVGAWAQGTPQTDPPKQDDDQEEVVLPVKWNEVVVGASTYGSNASISRYGQPATGFTLHRLVLFAPGAVDTPSARLQVSGMFNQDSLIDGYVAMNRGKTQFRWSQQSHSFSNFDWRPRDESQDRVTELSLDHSIRTGLGGYVTYASKKRDARYASPREAEQTRSRHVTAGIGGNVLGGNLSVGYGETRTYDDSGIQPRTLQKRLEGSYAVDFGEALSLVGGVGLAKIEQAGLPRSEVETYSLSGQWSMGPKTGLQFQFFQQDLDLNTILNAYIRKRIVSSARLIHRIPDGSFQFGFKRKEVERVRTDQTFVDVPKVDEYEGRVTGKIDGARWTLKGTWENLRASATMNTLDPRQLLWDDRATVQAKLDKVGDDFAAYGVYTYRFQQNKQREVEVKWHNATVGGTKMLDPAVSAFAEVSYDFVEARSEVEAGPGLDFYFPNSRSIALGVQWEPGPDWSGSAGLIHTKSADVDNTYFTFSFRQRLSEDQEFEVVLAPWRNVDRLYGLTGYSTTFLMARYTVRF